MMTERRAHWSDDLVDAVFRRMDGYAAGVVRSEAEHGTPTFDIIAAVEDSLNPNWDSMRELCRMQNESLREKLAVIEALQAAIARVRSVCESAITDYHRPAATKNGVARAEMARRILRALDSDA